MGNNLLAFQQQWLWRLMLGHEDWNCVVDYEYRLTGSLNVELLRKSIEAVVRRHESLRATIRTVEGVETQYVEHLGAANFEVLTLDPNDGETEARRWVEKLRQRKVDLAAGPLIHVTLLKLTEREHWLVLTVHRLIADCYAVGQVLGEIWAIYEHLLQGGPPPFRNDPPQYGAYVSWQHRTYQEWLRKHGAYWDERLSTGTNIRLPADKGLHENTRGALGRMNCSFGTALSARLSDLARRERTLPGVVMMAVYVALLWRWCSRKDFVVPVMIAGRQSEHRSVVGYFSQILYLRTELHGIQTFRELLNRVGSEFFKALSHQDFGRMALLRPELLAGGFFQWITSGHTQTWELNASALTVEWAPVRDFSEGLSLVPPGVVDVELTVLETAEGLLACGLYRADRFTSETLGRFTRDYRSLFELFSQDPNARVIPGC